MFVLSRILGNFVHSYHKALAMTLIASISGIRGTIGGEPGKGLTPPDILGFSAAFASLIRQQGGSRVVVGRDGRTSGPMLEQLVLGTLTGMGIDVIHLGLSATPTVEMAVSHFSADGGIILTASHNPAEWNALKLLNAQGEFLNDEAGKKILELAQSGNFVYAGVHELGRVIPEKAFDEIHIRRILDQDLVDVPSIRKAAFRVVVDGINSVGGLVVPRLLAALGVEEVHVINGDPDGKFAHPPEPVPANLEEICKAVTEHKAHLGIVVDPDVDRLALVDETGKLFGEEYTLVAVADYILKHQPGNTVSNLSSSRALRDITEKYGGSYAAAAVGEVNVVKKMKETGAVIGGEGNGGVIWPALHYGRDALAGIALFLSYLARERVSCSALRSGFPDYYMVKDKIHLTEDLDPDQLLEKLAETYAGEPLNREDGLRIDFDRGWVHLRKSNTEPILRIYAEAEEDTLARKWVQEIRTRMKS